MKILTEYKSKEEPNTLKAEYTYNVSLRDFKQGEAVGIYLKDLKPCTMALIESLLASYDTKKWKERKNGKDPVLVTKHYTSHPITLKYGDKQYKLYRPEDWKYTHQDEKDQIKTKTERHPILIEYLENRKKLKEYREKRILREQYNLIFDNFELPEEHEMEDFIKQLAPLYEIDVDYEDNLSKYRAYVQLKYYLDNDFEYSRPASDVIIMPVGNVNYLEDLIYKNTEKEYEEDNYLV